MGKGAKVTGTVDLHRHLDAQSPRAIKVVSEMHGLVWAGKTLEEIASKSQAQRGCTWNDWYVVHKAARKAVFVKPEVFVQVASEAIRDAEDENLDVCVLRFSLSMVDFCFREKFKRGPNFGDPNDRKEFLGMFDQIIENLSGGIALASSQVQTPLVFSFSMQDEFIPILDEIANVVINHRQQIAGTDLTNEQVHRCATEYEGVILRIRKDGINALTMHVGEKDDPTGRAVDEKGRRIYSTEERIRAALSLRPDTLGHAIYASGNRKLIEDMATSGVAVELCPTSNLDLNEEFVRDALKGDRTKYPLLEFQQAGLVCTINSDVPGSVAEASFAGEFELVRGLFKLGKQALLRLDLNAREIARKAYRLVLED